MKARILVAFAALFATSCASWFSSGPPPEEVAKSAAALLDSAEKSLDAVEPEQAQSFLDKAKGELAREELRESMLRPPLDERQRKLSARLPEVVQVALERRIEAAKATLAEALGRARSGGVDLEQKLPPEAAFDQTREAIGAANTALDKGRDLEAKDAAYLQSAEEARAELKTIKEKLDARWAEVEGEVLRISLGEKSKAVDDAIKAGDATAVAAASSALADAIAKGTGLEAKDKNYAKVAGAAREAGGRGLVYAHRAKVEAANTEVTTRIDALTDVEPDKYESAEAAVAELRKVIDEGAALREKDKRHAGWLAGMERTIDGRRFEIRKRRIDAADAQVVKRLETLASPDDFAEAEKSLRLLENTIGSNETFQSKDRNYARHVAVAKQRLAAHQARVKGRTAELEIEAARTKVDAAAKAAEEKLAAVAAQPDDAAFTAAEAAVKDLAEELDRPVPGNDKAFAGYLAQLKRKVPAYQADLERRRVEAGVAAHAKPVQEAEAALDAAIGALQGTPEPAAFDAATQAVDALTKAAEQKNAFAEKDKKHAFYIAAIQKKIAASTATIERRRIETLVAKSRTEVDAAAVAMDEQLKGTEFDAASQAVDALEKAVTAGAPAAEKDPKYAAYLAGFAKRIAGARASIDVRRTASTVAANREKVDAASKAFIEKLNALTDVDPALYRVAEEAGVAWQRAIEEGEPLGEKDAKHAKYMAAMRAWLSKQRLEIEKRRIDATEAKAIQALAAVQAGGQPELTAAEQSLEELADTTESKKSLLEKDAAYAKRIKSAELRVAQGKAALEARKLALAIEAQRTKVDALDAAAKEKLGGEDLKATEDAIAALEAEVAKGAPLAEKDKRFAAVLAAYGRSAAQQRAAVQQKRDAAAVAKHRAKVDEALKAVDEKLTALTEVTPSLYDAAVDAVSNLSKAVDEGAELAANDRAHAGYLAGIKGRLGGLGLEIRKRRLDANDAAVKVLVEALNEKPAESAYADAEKALRLYQNTAESSRPFLEKDKGYAKFAVNATRQVAGYTAAIAKKRVDGAVAAHRAEVDPAAAAVTEKLNALSGEPKEGDFSAAESAIAKLEEALDGGSEAAKTERTHASYLANLRAKLPAYRAGVERRRTEVAVAAHRAKVDAAAVELDAALEGLKSEKPDFSAAESASKALADAIADGGPKDAKDAKHAQVLAAVAKKVAIANAVIERTKLANELAAHRAQVEERAGEAKTQLEALASAEKPDFAGAERAIRAVESAVDGGASLGEKDKKYAGYLAGVKRQIPAQLAAVERARNGKQIAAHEARVAAAEKEVAEKLGQLTGTEPSLYQDAVASVSALKKTIDDGASLAEKDRAYAGRLAAIDRKLAGYDLEIRKRRLDANDASVAEKLKALEGTPKEGDFEAAESALHLYQNTLESNRAQLEKDKAYAKQAAAASQRIAAAEKTIARRRVELVVEAHRKKFEAAAGEAAEKVGALAGEPKESDFKAAEAAVASLEELLDDKETSAAERKQAAGFKWTIARRQVETQIASHRARVDAKLGEVEQKLGAMDDEAAFRSAEEAVGELEQSLDDPAAAKDKKHAGYLAGVKKKVPEYRRTIARRRMGLIVAAHREKVDAALATLDEKLKALEGDAPPFGEAESASKALTSVLEAEGEAAKDPQHAKYVAALRRRAEGAANAIERRRAELEMAQHRAKVDAASAAVKEKLDALTSSEPSLYEAAEQSVSALRSVVDEGGTLRERDPKYGKALDAMQAGIEGQRLEIRKRRIDATRAETEEKIQALRAEPTDANFNAAERTLRLLENTIQSNEKYLARDKAYAKATADAAKQAAGYSVQIERRRVDLKIEAQRAKVEAAAKSAAAAIEEADDAQALSAAERATSELADELDGGKELEAKDGKYRAYAASERKSVAAYKRRIEQSRFELEVKPNREKVTAAKQEAEEKVGALEDAASFTAAEEAISELAAALDDGESFAKRDKEYGKFVAAGRGQVARDKKRIERKRVEIALAEQRAKLDAAAAAAAEKLNALDSETDPEAFAAAEAALGELSTAIADALGVAAKDKAFGKRMAALRRAVPEQRNELARKRVEGAIRLAEQRVGALDKPDQAAFDAAEAATKAAKDAVEAARGSAKKDKKQKRWLAAVEKKANGLSREIGARRIGLLVGIHRAKVDEALESASSAVEAVAEKPQPGAFQVADDALEQLDAVVKAAGPAGKSKSHAKYLASVNKRVPGFRKTLAKARVAGDVAKHKSNVEEDHEGVEKALSALTEVTSDYQAAEDAISDFKRTLDAGQQYAAQDSDYASFLAKMERSIAESRREIRRKRLVAAQAAADQKLAALADGPSEQSFAEAESAVYLFENTTRSSKAFKESDKAYVRFVGTAEKRGKGYRAKIARVKRNVEVLGVQKRIETALADATDKMGSLEDASSVRDAEEAVKSLSEELSSGAALAKTNKPFKKYLAEKKSLARGFEKQLAEQKYDQEFGPAKAKVEAAKKELAEKMHAMRDGPSNETIEAVETAAGELESALGDAESLADRNARYKKYQATARKALVKSRALARSERLSLGRNGYREKLDSAIAASREKISGLGSDSDADAFKSANEAVDELSSVLKDGDAYAKKDKKLKKELLAKRKSLGRQRIAIQLKRVEVLEAAARAKVEAAGGRETEDTVTAIEELEAALDSGKALAKKDKKLKVASAKARKSAKKLKSRLGKPTSPAESGYASHKERVEQAKGAMKEALASDDIAQSEAAIADLLSVVAEGKAFGKKNKKYGKYLAAASKQAKKERASLKRRSMSAEVGEHQARVKEAAAEAAKAVASLKKKKSRDKVEAATQAVDHLEEVLVEGEPLGKKYATYRKFLTAKNKKLKVYRKQIKKKKGGRRGSGAQS